jgi:hypothetical protein
VTNVPPAADRGALAPVLRGTRRPVPALLGYYLLLSLLAGPGFVVVAPLLVFKYRTLRYEFDHNGLTVRWGVLFRREITLTYARIQDIHLVSNLVERWLGLGRVQIQTASGKAGAEATIEGLPDFEPVRDALYAVMRGARGSAGLPRRPIGHEPTAAGVTLDSVAPSTEMADVAALLRETAAELSAIRARLSRPRS